MHHVLEAKLVMGDMVFSIGSEFIENESEDVTKRDCELKAFHRLAKKIMQTFKRLAICIMGDSLNACESVFSLCDAYKWKYLCRFKEGRIKSLINPSIFELQHVHFGIETKGQHTYGMTVVDTLGVTGNEPNVHFAYKLDSNKFWDLMIRALNSYN